MSDSYMEIMDAIIGYFSQEEDEAIVVDCLLYLKETCNDKRFLDQIKLWMLQHNRCEKCGSPMSIHTWHEKKDDGTWMPHVEDYCHECTYKEGKNIDK